MLDLDNFYNANVLAGFLGAYKSRRAPFFGEALFPNARTNDLTVSWVKGYNAQNIVLSAAALDTHATIRSKPAGTLVKMEMPFFKEAIRFSEAERRDIQSSIQVFGNAQAESLFNPLLMSYAQLVDGCAVQLERMRMAVLAQGEFTIAPKPETGSTAFYNYNYDPSGEWEANNKTKILGTLQWTAANKATSNPIQDIITSKAQHQINTGAVATRILMNAATFYGICASETIRKTLQPLGGYASPGTIKTYLETESGCVITVYDEIYHDEFGARKKFVPDGYAILLPNGPVGTSYYGVTPTEYDLLGNSALKENIAITPEGVAIQTVHLKDPVNIETIVSAYCVPSFENMESVHVIKGF